MVSDMYAPISPALKSLLKAIAMSLPLMIWSTQSMAAPCNYFRHPPMNLLAADSKYKLSVIHITSGRKEGTAFLIDEKQGLFLTARHVVEASIAENGESPKPVIGRFEELNAAPFNLRVVADDVRLDVALLKTNEVDRLAARNA